MSGTQYVGQGLYGLRPRRWTSGMSVAQGETVLSPADWEDYKRIAATGGGSTDPADDTTNYVAASYERAGPLTGPATTGARILSWTSTTNAAKTLNVVSPALSAGVRTQILSLTGRGTLEFLACRLSGGSTITTDYRVELIVDGRTLANVLTTDTYNVSSGQLLVGSLPSTSTAGDFQPMPGALQFRRSAEIYFTSAAAATANVRQLWYSYRGVQ